MKREKNFDIIFFVVLLIFGFLILIFYNKVIGALVTISSFIPIHQEVIKIFKAMYEKMKNSNLVNNTQKANNANGDIKQAGRDIIEHITYPSPQLEEHDPTIDYKITQEVEGERLTFPKLWFVTHNPNPKRYEVYFTIHFIINNKVEHKIKEGLYGGTKSWNLLPHRGIKAPGLSIPKKIIKKYDNKNKLEIRIYCKAKDSKGNNHDLGSQGYIYQSKTNFWYLEP